ncbi:MAG TPA: hypothetical protein VH854_14755 [Thermoanaerobaculia bacterium]|jgi:hypothetical protein|nr:hypothetical protein [Thermoanaerobaculia bacterium]
MKRVLALCLVLGFSVASVVFAQDASQKTEKMSGKMMTGTVTKVDSASKSMTVKDDSGKETTVYWDDSTKVSGGSPTEGATVMFATMDKDGKTVATQITTKPKY